MKPTILLLFTAATSQICRKRLITYTSNQFISEIVCSNQVIRNALFGQVFIQQSNQFFESENFRFVLITTVPRATPTTSNWAKAKSIWPNVHRQLDVRVVVSNRDMCVLRWSKPTRATVRPLFLHDMFARRFLYSSRSVRPNSWHMNAASTKCSITLLSYSVKRRLIKLQQLPLKCKDSQFCHVLVEI